MSTEIAGAEQLRQRRELQSRLLAADAMASAAGTMAGALDHFASWLLGGLAAGLALIFSNLDRVRDFIDVKAVRWAGIWFLCAFALGVAQKGMAVITAGGARNFAAGRQLGEGQDVNLDTYRSETLRCFYWHVRWLVDRQLKKALAGDLAIAARLLVKLTQWQSIAVSLETLFVFLAVCALVHGLRPTP